MKIVLEKRRFVKHRTARALSTLLFAALPLSTLVCTPTSRADELQRNEQQGDNQQARSGVTEGILTAKGEGFIMVRANGENESTRLLPRWIGAAPKQGGGLDKQMLIIFQQLIVGSRLKVAWIYDEHFRAVKVQVLHVPGQDDAGNGEEPAGDDPPNNDGAGAGGDQQDGDNAGDDNDGDDNANGDGKADGDGKEKDEPKNQDAQAGVIEGVLNNKGIDWISVRPDGERENFRLVPRWLGGTHAQGGGPDKAVLRAIDQIKIGTRVRVEWLRDAEHLRVVSLRPVGAPAPK